MMWGITGVQKEAVLAARRALVTVEEIVDELSPARARWSCRSGSCPTSPCVPGGAHPSYAQGYSTRDNDYYRAWDAISADRDRFQSLVGRASSPGTCRTYHRGARRAEERSGGASSAGRRRR